MRVVVLVESQGTYESGDTELFTSAFTIGGSDNRACHPDKSTFLKELVCSIRQSIPNSSHLIQDVIKIFKNHTFVLERHNNQLGKKHYRAKSIGSGTKMSLGSQKLPADPLLLDGIGRVTLSNLRIK